MTLQCERVVDKLSLSAVEKLFRFSQRKLRLYKLTNGALQRKCIFTLDLTEMDCVTAFTNKWIHTHTLYLITQKSCLT